MSVLAILEHRGGRWNRVSFEALAAAQKLAAGLNESVEAVALGSDLGDLVDEAAAYGVPLITVNHPLLRSYTSDGYVLALEQLIRDKAPQAVVLPHTYQVRDFAPRLATRLGTVLVSDVVKVESSEGKPLFFRQLFGGKLLATVEAGVLPYIVSIQAGAFRSAEGGSAPGSTTDFSPKINDSDVRSKPEEPFRESQRSVDLGSAEVIVSVGRGIREKENLPLIEDLAGALGGELAASRPICDNGWLPMERQVGSSGQTVAPKLYIAIGISGAIQHLVGMKGSQTVVAINKDENAPIFETADYAITGDLFEIVPALVEQVKKIRS